MKTAEEFANEIYPPDQELRMFSKVSFVLYLKTFASQFHANLPEVTDKEIEKRSRRHAECFDKFFNTAFVSFMEGAKWYRSELRKRINK